MSTPFLMYDSASPFGIPTPPSTSRPLATSHHSEPTITLDRPLDPLPLSSSSTHSHLVTPPPTAGPSTMATTPLSPSRVKAFPHNADLLGSTSEVSSHSTSRRASPLPESAPVEESPPPRIRRRTSLHESIPFDRSTVAPDLHHFDNYPRGAINNLGPIEHLRRPSAPRQVSYGTSSSEEYTPAPVTAPRQVSSNRRIPATTSSYPATQPLSQLFMMYGTTGEGLAGNEVTTEPTVPPPRSSWRDSVPNFSPERRAEPEHAPMARSTSIGTAFRHRMLRERMARLDALRTMPNHPEEGERRLFGAPTTMNPAPDSMEVDDIGRWNQGVQEALARRLESPRSPLSTSRRREGGPNRREQAEALWGEMGAIPVDTATSGLHDMFHPRAPPVAGPSAAQDTYRRYRLPRAFESPEQRTVPSQTSPYRRPEVEPEWRGVYRGILGWDGPDTEHNTPSSTSRSYMPGTLLGTYRSGRTGTDSGSSDTQRSFRPDIPTMSRWASYTEERDPTGYTNLHAPIYRRMHLRSDMPMEEKVLMAKAVCRGMSRWPIEIRRKTAEEMVEKVAWGEMGVREGMERDECCSICHDEYFEETPVAVTPCKHMYHHNCLDTWLHTPNTSSCPMCRRDLAVLAVLRKMVPKGENEIMNLVTGELDKSGREAEALRIWMAL